MPIRLCRLYQGDSGHQRPFSGSGRHNPEVGIVEVANTGVGVLLNAGAIALVAAYIGARTGNRPLYSIQTFTPIVMAVWPLALGCVLVVLAGAAGYFNFSYSTWLLPSYDGNAQLL